MQIARIILFVYFFAHMYLHFAQVTTYSHVLQVVNVKHVLLQSIEQCCCAFFPFMLPGEVCLPAGLLQHPDGAAGALADEPPLVREDLQGDGENALQSQAERECENRLGFSSNRDGVFRILFFLTTQPRQVVTFNANLSSFF